MIYGSDKYIFHSIVLISFILHSVTIFSQHQEYRIETIPLKGELSSFSGTCIMQDSEGFMWFGSKDGLYRYDGAGFRIFRQDPENPKSLSSDIISSLLEDSEGYLWIGTHSRLNRFDKYSETFKSYPHNPHDSFSISNNYIDNIIEDREGNLWFATYTGFSRFDRKNDKFINYSIPRDDTTFNKSPYRIWQLHQGRDHYIWLRSELGLYRFDPVSGSIARMAEGAGWLGKICEDRSGRFWLAGWGLYDFNKTSNSLKRYLHMPGNPNRLHHQLIKAMIEDKDGNLWIRTLDGIYCYNQELDLKFNWKHGQVYTGTYDYDYLTRPFLEDNTGAIWFYTKDGINRIIRNTENFRINDIGMGGGGNFIKSISVERRNMIWVGALSGIYSLERTNDQFTLHYGSAGFDDASHSHAVASMYQDAQGILWIGMRHEGLFSLTRSEDATIQLKKYSRESNGNTLLKELNSAVIEHLFEDDRERIWIGTEKSGAYYYDKNENIFVGLVINSVDPDLWTTGERFHVRHLTDDQALLAMGPRGIYKLIQPFLKLDENHVMPSDIIQVGSLPEGSQVKASHLDSSGTLWLGMYKLGLKKFTWARDQEMESKLVHEKTYHNTDGLPDNSVVSIIEDESGCLWLGTGNGLSRFEIQSETFRNFYERHGLPVNRFEVESVTMGDEGELYFGTPKGMISFFPDSFTINDRIAPIKLTDFKIHNRSVIPGSNSVLSRSITHTESIELSHSQDHLSFEFAVLNYQDPELNQYKYMLEGLDKERIYSGSRNYAVYSNLRPGKYIFRVTGSNNDGVWNDEGASLQITIRPPPWRTWYAYLIYGLIVAYIILWYRRFLQDRAKLRLAAQVEKIEKEKVLEMDRMKSRFFANVSHEFRTPLTLLLGPVEELMKKLPDLSDENRGLLGTMKRNALRLQTLVNQLLDISKLETCEVKLEVSEGDLTGFIRAIVLSFLSLAESRNISYEYDLTEHPEKLFFDRDKLEKILTNLISNAFKFTPAGGKVILEMKFLNERDPEVPTGVQISVSDTGKGIPEAEQGKIFDRFYQVSDSDTREQEGTGIGLALTRELVEIYRGEIVVRSKSDQGSTFTVKLPIHKEAFNEEEILEGPVGSEEEPRKEVSVSEHGGEYGEQRSLTETADIDGPVILVVEDNFDLRSYISHNLVTRYRILEAENGREGFDKAVEEIPDLVISDLMMPEMDGMEMCKQLKRDERTSHIPVIMLTAKADRKSKLEGLETGADDYLVKPFDQEELQVRIKNLIEQRKRLKAKFLEEFRLMALDDSSSVPGDKLLLRVLEILKENISNGEYKVESMAGAIHLSRSQMFRKIAALTGGGPADLLHIMRMKKAAELLLSGNMNITRVMYEVGFQTPSYFARKFREYHGVNPSDFENSIRNR